MEGKLKVSKLLDYATLPAKTDEHSVGYDLTICRTNYKFAEKHVVLFDTGISVVPPEGYYVEVIPRSVISNTNFEMANSVGIIDPQYRGTIFLPLRYVGEGNMKAEAEALVGKKLAQLVVRKIYELDLEEVESELFHTK